MGCSRKAFSEKTPPATNDAQAGTEPMIATYIFAERSGSDTLILREVIAAKGFLRTSNAKREMIVPPNSYRLSFLSITGDTLFQSVNASTLSEHLESPQEDGSIHSVDVQLAEGAFVVRTTRPTIESILVERTFTDRSPQFIQRILVRNQD